MRYNKMTRQEKKSNQLAKREESLHGSGLFVYKNNTSGELVLPKATASGKKSLVQNEEFQGDSYYMRLVPTMLRYIRCIIPAKALQENKETNMSEKLILDQPERVTDQGTVEQIVAKPKQALNESKPKSPVQSPDVLLTEDPMEGVEIILNG